MMYTIGSVWCVLIILKPILTLEQSCNIYHKGKQGCVKNVKNKGVQQSHTLQRNS